MWLEQAKPADVFEKGADMACVKSLEYMASTLFGEHNVGCECLKKEELEQCRLPLRKFRR